MKLKLLFLLLILPLNFTLSAQGRVVLNDTIFDYYYPVPGDSVLSSMIALGSAPEMNMTGMVNI